jgi:hypothetical protein
MEEVKVICEPDDKIVRDYLKKIIGYLNHKKLFQWIKHYLKHLGIASSQLVHINERKKSLTFLKRFQRAISQDLFPIPSLRKIKATPSIWERSFIFQDHKKIQKKLMDICKTSKEKGNRSVLVRKVLAEERIELGEKEFMRVIENLGTPHRDTRKAAAVIVGGMYRPLGTSGVLKIISNMSEDEHGIVHFKGFKGEKRRMK